MDLFTIAVLAGAAWYLFTGDDGYMPVTDATATGVPATPGGPTISGVPAEGAPVSGATFSGTGTLPRPAGDPPNPAAPAAYDANRYGSRADILDAFSSLGYSTPPSRDTMNDLGADGALGGGDDVPSPVVRQFQQDYNAVSRAGVLGGAGGLDTDGMVGPLTLNGMAYALDSLPVLGLGPWQQVVQSVKGG